jgi:peptidyl-prolyl cis-trans isomerase SDCCAG10
MHASVFMPGFCLHALVMLPRLQFSVSQVKDPNARRDDVDDYVVIDPLLEAAKGKFSKANQKAKKSQTAWAGKAQG